MNNSASNERKVSAPDHPAFFLKPSSCLVGHNEPIRIRSYYGSVHPEPELALVIGREVRDIPAARALDAVFGYTIFDDITGNGMRAEDRFHYYALYPNKNNPNETERVEQHLSYAGRYKGTDTFGAMGPWLVTRDEIANPDDLAVRCTVGGEVVAEDSTRYYNYKVAEVVSFISQFHTLQPGDIVSLGTAFKPGATRKSIHTANLQTVAGPIEIAIDGLGVQTNPVIVEKREIGHGGCAETRSSGSRSASRSRSSTRRSAITSITTRSTRCSISSPTTCSTRTDRGIRAARPSSSRCSGAAPPRRRARRATCTPG